MNSLNLKIIFGTTTNCTNSSNLRGTVSEARYVRQSTWLNYFFTIDFTDFYESRLSVRLVKIICLLYNNLKGE